MNHDMASEPTGRSGPSNRNDFEGRATKTRELRRRLWGLAFSLLCCAAASGQEASREGDKSQEAARREILQSERWRRTNRELNEWLSAQRIYTPAEVADIRAAMQARVTKMTPRELATMLEDMEARLEVLTSPEAEDARRWLAEFMAVARNPEQQLGRARPDVLNMTASQIREEIEWLARHREGRRSAQAAFDRQRAGSLQGAREVQEVRQQARQPAPNRSSWPAHTARPQYRSRYSPRPDLQPAPMGPSPLYDVGPWGNPVYWHPLNNVFR
jgi:hypothetical protein